jgi:hypothetical protein
VWRSSEEESLTIQGLLGELPLIFGTLYKWLSSVLLGGELSPDMRVWFASTAFAVVWTCAMCLPQQGRGEDGSEPTPQLPTPTPIPTSQGSGNDNGNGFVDCLDARLQGHTQSGLYTVNPSSDKPFTVECDMDTDGGGWTVFQRSQTNASSPRHSWHDYVHGYTENDGNFWLGLEQLHLLTSKHYLTQMRVDVTDMTNGTTKSVLFEEFFIDSRQQDYEPYVRKITTGGGKDGVRDGKNGIDPSNDNDSADDDIEGLSLWAEPLENDSNSDTDCEMKNVGRWWFTQCKGEERGTQKGSEGKDADSKPPQLVQMKIRAVL